MQLINLAVAITAGLSGTLGAGLVYEQVRQPPSPAVVVAGQEVPVVFTSYRDCRPPAVLDGEECVTTTKIYRLPKATPPPPPPPPVVRVVVVNKPAPARHHDDDDDDDDEHEGGDDD